MPNKTTYTHPTEGQRPTEPCKVCQVQLGLECFYIAHRIYDHGTTTPPLPTTIRTKIILGASFAATLCSLYILSDAPKRCRDDQKKGLGHLWARQWANVVENGRQASHGAQHLAGWFQEWCSSLNCSDHIQDQDYDFCEVEGGPGSLSR